MNLREAKNDSLQSDGLDARMLLGCRPGLSGVQGTVNITFRGCK